MSARWALVVMALFCCAHTAGAASTAVGHWEGQMKRSGAFLAVSFDFSENPTQRGFFSAPDLGAIDIPVAKLALGEAVHWELVGDATTTVFDGTIAGDAMRGTFRESGSFGTFTLHHTSRSVQKPYTEEEVRFHSGAVTLAGTVYAPRTGRKHPAMLFVHGSGGEGRYASRYLADYVARHGIVALIYDKRGVGESTGDWHTATMKDLSADARAGVGFLAQRSDVDPRSIGAYGHSQGGTLVPSIAQNDDEVGWIIDGDGVVGPQYKQDLYRVRNAMSTDYSGDDLANAMALYGEFVDVAREGSDRTQLRADEAKYAKTPWLRDLGLPADDSWVWNWYRNTGNYDNTTAWQAVSVPVLIVFGQNDTLVPPEESIATVTALLRAHGNRDVTVRVLPGADHGLHIPPSQPSGWPHNPPGFPALITTWIWALHR